MKTKILNLGNSYYQVPLSLNWGLLFNTKYYENIKYLKLKGSIFGKELPRHLYSQINLENVQELTIENFRKIGDEPFYPEKIYKVPLTIKTTDNEGIREFEMTLNNIKIWNGDYTFVKSFEGNNYSRFYNAENMLYFHPFANIRELNFLKGKIDDFPYFLNYFVMKSEKSSFSFLKKVSLFKCSITNKDYNTFPSFVKNLAICSCGLKIMPKGLHSNNNLEILNLAFNKIDFIPDFITCNSLQELDLSFNQITESTIGKLPKSLTKLILTKNPLKKLPLTILDLENLMSLDISATQITELSESLSSASHLTKLREVILKYTTIDPVEKKKLVDNFPKVKFIFE